jgi:hypothetical protein
MCPADTKNLSSGKLLLAGRLLLSVFLPAHWSFALPSLQPTATSQRCSGSPPPPCLCAQGKESEAPHSASTAAAPRLKRAIASQNPGSCPSVKFRCCARQHPGHGGHIGKPILEGVPGLQRGPKANPPRPTHPTFRILPTRRARGCLRSEGANYSNNFQPLRSRSEGTCGPQDPLLLVKATGRRAALPSPAAPHPPSSPRPASAAAARRRGPVSAGLALR